MVKKFEDRFSRFDRIPAYDRRTDNLRQHSLRGKTYFECGVGKHYIGLSAGRQAPCRPVFKKNLPPRGSVRLTAPRGGVRTPPRGSDRVRTPSRGWQGRCSAGQHGRL